jgi:DNA gyrase/topoisomerase IV subunit B
LKHLQKDIKKSFKQVCVIHLHSLQSKYLFRLGQTICVIHNDAIRTKISDNRKEFTRITFMPDLKRFQMDKFDDDLVVLFKRRAYDVVISTSCKVTLNGKRILVRLLFFGIWKDCFYFFKTS